MEDFLTRHVGMDSAAVKCLLSSDVVANVIVVETISDVAATVSSVKLLMSDNDVLKQLSWRQFKLKQLRGKLDGELSDVGNTLMEVSGIALPSPVPRSSVLSRTAILKKELLKEAVVKLKLVESTAELLSQRIRVRVAQLRGTFSPAPQSSFFRVLCLNGLHLSWDTALSELAQAEHEEFPGPFPDNVRQGFR